MKTVLENMEHCVGCASCVQRCSKKCIVMKADAEGFLFPEINQAECVDCGLCRKVCPVESYGSCTHQTSLLSDKNAKPKVFACWIKNDDVRLKSSSGGLFSALAENTFIRQGVVCGAAFEPEFNVRHACVTDCNDLDRLRRSKYVQSDIGDSYIRIEEYLKGGMRVLFAGMPCQVAGLRAFLGREYENLLTVGLACNGVPSPAVWSLYLDYLKELYGAKIVDISFRDKQKGWLNSSMKVEFTDGRTYVESVYRDTYFIGYGKGIFSRKSCFECRFRLQNTKADITIADFWGADKLSGIDVSDNKGVTLLIVNTEKGNNALNDIKSTVFMQERLFDEAVKGNPRLLTSCSMPKARADFFNDVKNGKSFRVLRKKYMNNYGLTYKMKMAAKAILSPKIVEYLNKVRTR